MKYVISKDADPNFVDLAISRAVDRKIYFTYGDLSQPKYSYKDEEAIITSIVPQVDYKNNTINYTIKATSATSLSYSIKRTFISKTAQPSQEIMRVLYNNDYEI